MLDNRQCCHCFTKEKTGMTGFLDSDKHNMNITENLFYTWGFS